MAQTLKVLIKPKMAESVPVTQYTADGVTAVIEKFTATNTGTANVDLTIFLVSAGSSPANGNSTSFQRTIGPGEAYACPEVVGHFLEAGDFISTIATIPGVLSIRASGREIS